MRPLLRSMFFCSAIVISASALKAQAPGILEPKFERHQGPPLWISAEMVADSEKIIDLDMLDDFNLRGYVEKQRRSLGEQSLSEVTKTGNRPTITNIPRSKCTSEILSSELLGGDHPSASIKDLATYSRSILRGTIRTIDPGFASGVPTSLLGVEVSGAVKGSKPRSPIYINYPVAHFSIGPLSFCNAEKGFEPHPGDEILLFDYIGPIDREQALYTPRLEQIFFQSQNRALFLPSRLKNTPEIRTARSLDDVVEQLKATGALRDSGGGAR